MGGGGGGGALKWGRVQNSSQDHGLFCCQKSVSVKLLRMLSDVITGAILDRQLFIIKKWKCKESCPHTSL